jgi:hypothetical protein
MLSPLRKVGVKKMEMGSADCYRTEDRKPTKAELQEQNKYDACDDRRALFSI